MKKQTLLLLYSLFLLLLASCHSEKDDADYTNSLKIGYIPSTDIFPYLVAQQQGIFDSLQLDIKLMAVESEYERDSLFREKKTDGSILSPMQATVQQIAVIPIVPTLNNLGLSYLVAAHDSTLTKLSQLSEKTVSVVRGSAQEFFADKVIEKLEIELDEVNKPSISTESLRLQMLTNGQFNATVLRDPCASMAVENDCKILASSASYPITLSVTAFSDSILNSKKEDIQKLVIGYNLAVQYMKEHPKGEWLAKTVRALGIDSLSHKLPSFKKTSGLANKEVEDIVIWMKGKNMLPESYNKPRINHSVVNETRKSTKKQLN